MGEWWESRESQWLRRHALAAPFGVFIVTAALTYMADPSQWNSRESLQSAAKLVDLGTVLYAMFAVLVDGGLRIMFYALQKHREWREEREQRQAQLRADALAKGRAEERQRTEAWLTRVAEKEGIPLERLLPPSDEDSE